MNRPSRKFTNEEVSRIFTRALNKSRDDTISYGELMETATEMGLDPAIVEEAIQEEGEVSEVGSAREKWLAEQRSGFYIHLWTYLIVNIAMFLLNLLTGGPWWFHYVLWAWAIGLAIHIKPAFFPSEGEIENGTRKILTKMAHLKSAKH